MGPDTWILLSGLGHLQNLRMYKESHMPATLMQIELYPLYTLLCVEVTTEPIFSPQKQGIAFIDFWQDLSR